MDDLENLAKSIANTVADYRKAELLPSTHHHVLRWVNQFRDEARLPILHELNHVLSKTYFSEARVQKYLLAQIKSKTIAGDDPKRFWKEANYLNIQLNGHSQKELLSQLDYVMKSVHGFSINDCGSPCGHYIYLDDAIFSGLRVVNDLTEWIKTKAPQEAKVEVIIIASHTLAEYQSLKKLTEVAHSFGKNISFRGLRAVQYENRKAYRQNAEVLWPTVLPDHPDASLYINKDEKFPFSPRPEGGTFANGIFSSEQGRQLLERELLLAGIDIIKKVRSPKSNLRPLGFSRFGLGFGSMLVTYRNCPNNCPLALWWGDSNASSSSPLHWFPLFPRKTYGSGLLASPDDL